MRMSRSNESKRRRQVILLGFVMALASLLLMPGCSLFSMFSSVPVVKHPDAPMLIIEAKEDYLRVAIYDSAENKMIEYGWVEVNDRLNGWTITKYNWEAAIEKERRAREHE